MKNTSSITVIILLAMLAGCGEKQSEDELITINVAASYSEKELILQDFMDVEYIPLETNDEFITHGIVQAVGKSILLITNRSDGDILVYDRSGKALRKINRKGQGGEEYSHINGIVLDEDRDEMFVRDAPARKILVYDLRGNFKRSFPFADTSYYPDVYGYDRDHLICYKSYSPIDTEQSGHILISKQDGSFVRKIPIPIREIISSVIEDGELIAYPIYNLTVPSSDAWALSNISSDTVYSYLPNGEIRPLIVRKPSIHSTEKEVFLFQTAITDRYYFMYTMKKEIDPNTFKIPIVNLVYDKQEKAMFGSVVYNDDFLTQKRVYLNSGPLNHEIATWQRIEAFELVEAYEEGKLKDGKLKEIAADLDEEANAVIMLIKHKN